MAPAEGDAGECCGCGEIGVVDGGRTTTTCARLALRSIAGGVVLVAELAAHVPDWVGWELAGAFQAGRGPDMSSHSQKS